MFEKKVDVDASAEVFSMLSDPTRLSFLTVLADGPTNVTVLCEALNLKQPSASHHMGLLRATGLVAGERAGKSITYTINAEALADAAAFLSDLAQG
jgi:DNA-binding transcriptional ArsR family regulator